MGDPRHKIPHDPSMITCAAISSIVVPRSRWNLPSRVSPLSLFHLPVPESKEDPTDFQAEPLPYQCNPRFQNLPACTAQKARQHTSPFLPCSYLVRTASATRSGMLCFGYCTVLYLSRLRLLSSPYHEASKKRATPAPQKATITHKIKTKHHQRPPVIFHVAPPPTHPHSPKISIHRITHHQISTLLPRTDPLCPSPPTSPSPNPNLIEVGR